MTMGELARRLRSAADELAGMRAELAHHEIGYGRAGSGARELAAVLDAAWLRQQELIGRLVEGYTGLSAGVEIAARNYREADEFKAGEVR